MILCVAGGETVEKTVNNVEVIGVKKITGVDDTGTIWIALVDGSDIGLRFHPDVPGAVIVEPSKKYVAPVFENGILKGFSLRR